MSSLSRSKPSFIIYRDEPVDSQTSSNSTTTIISPPPARPTVSTSLSFSDKENAALQSHSAITEKSKGKSKLTRSATLPGSKSAPTSPLARTSTDDQLAAASIRRALATKFVAAPVKSTKSKSKSSTSSSSSQSRRATSVSASVSSTENPPRIKRAHSSTGTRSATGEKKRKVVALAPVVEEDAACGSDGLTVADRRARDLTQLPLGDISGAYPTSATPDGFANVAPTISRKRSRAHSIIAREHEPTNDAPAPSSQMTSATEPESVATGSTSITVVVSEVSPHKRVRLSPKSETTPLPPISTQATLVEEAMEEPIREPTLVGPSDIDP